MQIFDIGCFYGHWPFQRLPENSIGEIALKCKENGVENMLFTSIDAIFYRDPAEGDEELAEALTGLPYGHIITVNPAMPASIKNVKRDVERFHAKGLRIFPGYHGYALNDPCMSGFVELARLLRLPLLVNMRLEDERLNHIVKPTLPVLPDVQGFLEEANGIQVILSNIYLNRMNELNLLQNIINDLPNVYFDTCGLKDTPFIYDTLLSMFPAEKIVYASQMPVYAQASSLYALMHEVSEKDQRTILYNNALKIFDL